MELVAARNAAVSSMHLAGRLQIGTSSWVVLGGGWLGLDGHPPRPQDASRLRHFCRKRGLGFELCASRLERGGLAETCLLTAWDIPAQGR